MSTLNKLSTDPFEVALAGSKVLLEIAEWQRTENHNRMATDIRTFTKPGKEGLRFVVYGYGTTHCRVTTFADVAPKVRKSMVWKQSIACVTKRLLNQGYVLTEANGRGGGYAH